MKKLLLVGVVGLSALLAGCGGGGDCDEEGTVTPPVTEAQFPRGQTPDYIVRSSNEIGFSRVGNPDYSAQVLSIEMGEEDYSGEFRITKVLVQEFIADYSEGYLTKPTNNVHEYGYATFRATMGSSSTAMTNYDIKKIGKSVVTVQRRGGDSDFEGNFLPIFDVAFSALGVLNEITDDHFIVNGIQYPRGIADDNEGGVDIVVGGYVAGIMDGDKLNIAKLSFAGPAWGITLNPVVSVVIDESSFSYVDVYGNDVVVTLREPLSVEKTDRILSTSNLVVGETVVITATSLDYNNQEILSADVFKLSK